MRYFCNLCPTAFVAHSIEKLDNADLVTLVDSLCRQFLYHSSVRGSSTITLKDIFTVVAEVADIKDEDELHQRYVHTYESM